MEVKQLITIYLPWIVSFLTIYMMIAVGDKDRKGWIMGLCCQFLWGTWIFVTESWGLLPLTLFMTWVCVRNYIKWGKD